MMLVTGCVWLTLAVLPLASPAEPPQDPGSAAGLPRYYETRPSPDPTVLTSQQLFRELLSLRTILETRLDGMDKALFLLQRILDRIPQDIENRVQQLQGLHAEKFKAIENQFVAGRIALDTALASLEKATTEKNALQSLAIAKSEANVNEQLKGIAQAGQQVERGLNDKVQGLKERLDRQEGQSTGISAAWVVLLVVIGIISTCVAIFGAIRSSAAQLEVRAKS
jgi:hypothetical protein